MNDVKLYTFTLFCAALASAFFELSADEKQKKQLSYITGLFMLICVVSPFSNAVIALKELSFSPDKTTLSTIDTDAVIEKELSARLEKIIIDKLDDNGIFDADIGIEITVSKQEADIGIITILLPSAQSGEAEKAKQLIENELGLTAEIQFTGG